MASKYVIDDGLDLDSRYLGINAKDKRADFLFIPSVS